ncbi:MAG: energy-coupling factor transporter transmembrane component T [Bacillota bacterium]|nr:energy-coupling factor transporter transmembrane component T [Bacillota bacterium]
MIRNKMSNTFSHSAEASILQPETKLIGNLFFLLAVLLAPDFTYLLCILVVQVVLAIVIKTPPRTCLTGMKSFLWIIILTAGFQLLMTPGEILWQWKVITISREGLWHAGFIGMQLLQIIFSIQILLLNSKPVELAAGFGRILQPLQRVRIPTGELVMVMTISLSFIPIMMQEARDIRQAQKARGALFNTGSLQKRLRAQLALLVPLFSAAFRRADDLATAMEGRGYIPGQPRTSMYETRLQKADYMLLTISICLFLSMWIV